MRYASMVFTALLLAGCVDSHPAERSSIVGVGVQVDRLFEKDGVVVYRFADANHYHYYAVPQSGVGAVAFSDYGCGKGCYVNENVSTVAR